MTTAAKAQEISVVAPATGADGRGRFSGRGSNIWEQAMGQVNSKFKRNGTSKLHLVATKDRNSREHAELVDSIWRMKSIHGDSLQTISREYGIGYRAAEDLLVEGALKLVRKERTLRRNLEAMIGGPYPKPMVMRRAA